MVTKGRPFKTGNKLGRGRPPGSRNKKTGQAQEILDTNAEPLMKRAVFEALKGDKPTMRILLNHLLPRNPEQPPKTGPLPIGTAQELAQSLESIMGRVAAGKITIHDACELARFLETQRRVLETSEFEARLRAVEQRVVEAG